MEVSETILRQLGGANKLRSMIGAKLFVGNALSLQFKWSAKAANKANCCVVRLDAAKDLYTMELWQVRGADTQRLFVQDSLYADQLVACFQRQTGLDIRL